MMSCENFVTSCMMFPCGNDITATTFLSLPATSPTVETVLQNTESHEKIKVSILLHVFNSVF